MNNQDYDLEKDSNMEEIKYSKTYKIIVSIIWVIVAFTPILCISFMNILNKDTFPFVAFITIVSPLIAYHQSNKIWNVRYFRNKNDKY